MNIILVPLIQVLSLVLNLAQWGLVIYAVLSWLIAFNIVKPRGPMVAQLGAMLHQLIEPLLRPIRRVVPSMGGLDLSFLVLFLIIILLQKILVQIVLQIA